MRLNGSTVVGRFVRRRSRINGVGSDLSLCLFIFILETDLVWPLCLFLWLSQVHVMRLNSCSACCPHPHLRHLALTLTLAPPFPRPSCRLRPKVACRSNRAGCAVAPARSLAFVLARPLPATAIPPSLRTHDP